MPKEDTRLTEAINIPQAGQHTAKLFLGRFYFVKLFVITTEIVPPAGFLCNVAATSVSLLAREHFAL